MAKTIQQLQADLAAFRASRGSGSSTAVAEPPVPTPAPAPAASPTNDAIGQALASYRSQRAAIPKDNPNALADFAKGIFSAPATMIARPFQAAAEVGQALGGGIDAVDPAAIDAATKKIPIVGGLIAPVPRSFNDLPKDVGRAAQTVALGLSPIAGGALFGAGASVEQGNSLLSTQTAFDTALGAAGGKVLGMVGKPLLNAAGKVVGTITPKILKDVAAQGSEAITKFAAQHDLLGGIAAKPSELLAKGAQAVDTGITTGVKKITGGTGSLVRSQYPGISPEEHFKSVNAKDIIKPTTINKPAYANATAVFKDAAGRGIDLQKVATQRGIIHDQIAEGGVYNTSDVAEQLRKANYATGKEMIRPALNLIEPDVQRIPVTQVRGALIKQIHDLPPTEMNATDKASAIKQINKKYADGSVEDTAHPHGYSLTDLYDSRIESQSRGKYQPGVSTEPNILKAKLARSEGRVFAGLFDRSIPVNSGLDAVRKESEQNFLLADYLDALNKKRVPQGITAKAVRLFGRGLGGVIGSKVGGFPGFLVGSRGGDMLFDSFETLPNPLKRAVLSRAFANRAKSPAFDTLQQYLGTKETERLLQKALPAAGQSSYKEPVPTLYTTPGGKTTPNKSEAIDLTAVEQGKAKPPKTDRRLSSYLKKVNAAQGGDTYTPPDQLPVIKMGKKPKPKKNLSDIFIK